MNRLRTALLLAITALALTSMTAPAWAQSGELSVEDGGHCGDVTEESNHDSSGGCELTLVSTANATTFAHTGASEVSTTSCETELVANIDENGTGYVDTTETTIHTNPIGGCGITVCEEAAPSHSELEWPVVGGFEYGPNEGKVVLSFCIRAVNQSEGQGSTCTVILEVDQNPTTHVLTFIANQEPCHENPTSEISGTWQTTGANEAEIIPFHYPGNELG